MRMVSVISLRSVTTRGDCAGTCPACEEEIRYLEHELKARKGNGFSMKVAGIAAGICATVMPMTAAAQAVKSDSTANRPVHTAKKGDVKVVRPLLIVVHHL